MKESIQLLLILSLLSCQPSAKTDEAGDGRLQPEGCLDSEQSPLLLPLDPGLDQCTYPSEIEVNTEILSADFSSIRQLLETAANQAYRENTNRICVDGCPFLELASYLPRFSKFRQTEGRRYQMSEPCTPEACSSGPVDLTKKGWSFLIVDLIGYAANQGAGISSEKSINIEALIDFYKQTTP